MDLILVFIIGAIVATTGVVDPKSNEVVEVEKIPQVEVSTPVVQEVKPEPEPEPEPAKEPEPVPEPVPDPIKEPEPIPEQEEPKEEVNVETTPVQDAKPEEEVAKPVQEEVTESKDQSGISMLNIILY